MPQFEPYIKVFEWLMQHPELSMLDALLVAQVMRFDLKGCYQTNYELGKLFKKSPRHIQRAIKSLVKRQWLAPLYITQYNRLLWASPKEPPNGPIKDYKEKVMPKLTQSMIQRTAKQLSLW